MILNSTWLNLSMAITGSEYKAIEVHRREGNFWRQYHYREGDLVVLKSIGVRFPFDAVYRRIPL